MSGSPFHPGELEAQARAGGGSRGSGPGWPSRNRVCEPAAQPRQRRHHVRQSAGIRPRRPPELRQLPPVHPAARLPHRFSRLATPGDPAAPCRERRRSSGMVRRRAPSPEPSASGSFASVGPGASAACSPCAGPFARSTYREPGTSTPSCARSPPRRANQTRTLRGMECRSSIPHASLAPEGIRRVAPAGRLGRRDRPACETRGRAP